MDNEEFTAKLEKMQMEHNLRMFELREKRYTMQRRWKMVMLVAYFILAPAVGWEISEQSYGWAATHAMMAYWMAKNYFDDKFLNE